MYISVQKYCRIPFEIHQKQNRRSKILIKNIKLLFISPIIANVGGK